MAVKFDVMCAYNKAPKEAKGKFKESAKKVLQYLTQDPVISDVRVAAYLLATAHAEAAYSLARWEGDSACNSYAVAMYPPCEAAIRYYRQTKLKNGKSKRDYFTMGVDSQGYPYYGRGLIQLTGKANYEEWGKKLGVDLAGHAELAFRDDISYRIASRWIQERCFPYIKSGDLRMARQKVNGGDFGLAEVNHAYQIWYKILTECGATPVEGGSGIKEESGGINHTPSTGGLPGSSPDRIVGAPPPPPPPPPRKLRTFGVIVVGELGSDAAATSSNAPQTSQTGNGKTRQMTEVEPRVISNPNQPLDVMAVPSGEVGGGNVDRAVEVTEKASGGAKRDETPTPSVAPKAPTEKKGKRQRNRPKGSPHKEADLNIGAPSVPSDLSIPVDFSEPPDPFAQARNDAERLGLENIEGQRRAAGERESIDTQARTFDPNPSVDSKPLGEFDPNVVEYVPEYEEEGVISGDPPPGYQDEGAEGMGYAAEGDADGSLGNNVKTLGGVFPVISVNGYTFSSIEVKSATIDSTGFYPIIDLTVSIEGGSFLSRKFPKDGDLISIFLRSHQDQLKPVRGDYIITRVSTSNSKDAEGGGITIFMTGNLRVPLLYGEVSKSIKGTSMEALLQISKDLQLGFVTNESDMQDSMVWRSAFDTYKDFIRAITDHSWKSDDSYFISFIDIYYNLNFINLNKIMGIDDKAEWRDGLTRSELNIDYTSDASLAHTKTRHLLTNYPQYRGTNYYVQNIRMMNKSGVINLTNGYKRFTHFYDKGTETHQDLYVDPITTEGAEQRKYLMKGRAGENYYMDQTKRKWMGIQVSGENGNVHPYFKFAKMHNFQNREEQHKINLVTSLPAVNMNFHMYQRVPVLFTITKDIARAHAASNTDDNAKENGWTADRFLTGNYCITGIKYIYYGGAKPSFQQEITLSRREWSMPNNDPRYTDGQKYSL